MGQNYLRSLLALGFQAFLIIVCVAIYAVLVQNIATEDDIIMAIWTCVGYTVLLCFTLFKTGQSRQSSVSSALRRLPHGKISDYLCRPALELPQRQGAGGSPKIITQPCRTNSCTNFRYLRWLLIPVFYFYGVLFPNCRKR